MKKKIPLTINNFSINTNSIANRIKGTGGDVKKKQKKTKKKTKQRNN